MFKKLILTALFCTIIYTPLSAQTLRCRGIQFSITDNKSNWDPYRIYANSLKDKKGFSAGVFLEFFRSDESDFLTFLTELNYDYKKLELRSDNSTVTESMNTKMHYLSIPIMLKMNFPNEYCSFFAAFGPRVTYKFKQESDPIFAQFQHLFKKTAFGISMRAGVETDKILPFLLKFEIRHRYDLTNSYYENGGPEHTEMKFSSIDISFAIGF